MLVKFKKPYTVQVVNSTIEHSGEFVFKKGYSYYGKFKCGKLHVFNNDGSATIKLTKNKIKEYVE